MSSPKFRKADQYYEDQYDSRTISSMKEKEDEWTAKLKLITNEDELLKKRLVAYMDIREYGTRFSQNKRHSIQEWITTDERKDRLVNERPIPPPPYCPKCDSYMKFSDYDFVNNNCDIQFIFSCGGKTKHNAILESNGKPLTAPKQFCPYCNGVIKTKVKKTKTKITATDSCTICTWSDTIYFDIQPKQQLLPISEEERKAYCTDFKKSKGFLHDLEVLASISAGDDTGYDLSKIKMLKVADLDKILTEALQKNQFIKLQFEPPKITGHMTIHFSTLDTSERTEQQSIKTLKKIISEALFFSNWRLMSTEINYRLGYLTGQLKGVDQKEDLQKIATEINTTP